MNQSTKLIQPFTGYDVRPVTLRSIRPGRTTSESMLNALKFFINIKWSFVTRVINGTEVSSMVIFRSTISVTLGLVWRKAVKSSLEMLSTEFTVNDRNCGNATRKISKDGNIKNPCKVNFCNVKLHDVNMAFNWIINPFPITANVLRLTHLSMYRADQLLSKNFDKHSNCKDWIYCPKRSK